MQNTFWYSGNSSKWLILKSKLKMKQGKVNYAVSEKEVGCDNIDDDDKGDRRSR